VFKSNAISIFQIVTRAVKVVSNNFSLV